MGARGSAFFPPDQRHWRRHRRPRGHGVLPWRVCVERVAGWVGHSLYQPCRRSTALHDGRELCASEYRDQHSQICHLARNLDACLAQARSGVWVSENNS